MTSDRTMHAISLWQPYASLIAVGAKRFETRDWPPPRWLIGKRVAIHAAARKPTRAEIEGLDEDVTEAFGFCNWPARIPYGAVVCTATLAAASVVRDWDGPQPVLADGRTIRDDGFGDYAIGRHCWEMCDVRGLHPAVPARGSQGWWRWNVPAEQAEAVHA